MKSFKIKLKGSNFIKGVRRKEDVYATIKLENGKELELTFIQTNKTIEVTSLDKAVQKNLSEEERVAIIERILNDYATFLNSILKSSIALYIEEYRLIDCTGKRYSSNMTILEEFVNSKYSRDTQNKSLKTLVHMNDQITQNLDKIGKEEVQIAIPNNLPIVDKSDAMYFFTHLLKEYVNTVEIKKVKGNILLLKPIK